MSDEVGTKITLRTNYPDGAHEYSIAVDKWDLTLGEFFETIIFPLTVAAGYDPQSVSKYLE